MSEALGLKVAGLYAGGSSFGAISEELAVSKSRVGDLLRDGIEFLRNNNSVQDVLEQENRIENDGLVEADLGGGPDLNGMLEKTILIQAQPIFRKVALNSKVYLQHEYFQKTLGYQGDVGDLLVEALDYYWKEMGFTIKITHDSVV